MTRLTAEVAEASAGPRLGPSVEEHARDRANVSMTTVTDLS